MSRPKKPRVYCAKCQIVLRLENRSGICGRCQGRKPPNNQMAHIPTPEEIREACLEIQSEWSPEDFEKRSFVKTRPEELRPQKFHGQ